MDLSEREKLAVTKLKEWYKENKDFPEAELKSCFDFFSGAVEHQKIEARQILIQCIYFCKKTDLDMLENKILSVIDNTNEYQDTGRG